MTITIARENLADCLEEVKPLLKEHWAEIALFTDEIALDPDYTLYLRFAAAGGLLCYVVREDGVPVGYAAYVVKPHPHYRQNKWAISDIFWLHPHWRGGGVGRQLFAFIEDDLRAEGVSVMHSTTKAAHPEAGTLLTSMGHDMVETGYSKRL